MKQFNHQPLIIAHRGAGFGEEENSLKAYKRALKMGVDGIEMDLRMTKDGVIVCHHDRGVTPLRPSGFAGRGRHWIDEMLWSQLRRIKKVERFEEVVKALKSEVRSGKLGNSSSLQGLNPVRLRRTKQPPSAAFASGFNPILDLDLKQEGMEGELAMILRKYKIKKILVNSTDVWTLKAFEDVFPHCELVLSYHPRDPRDLINHKAIRFLTLLTYYSLKPLLFRLIRRKTAIGDIQAASLNYRLVNKKVVQFLQQYNIKVFVWGADEERKLKEMVALGVDGVKTRRPDLLRNIIGRI